MKNKKISSNDRKQSQLSVNQLLLHKEIYNCQALQRAMAAFGSLARITVTENKLYYCLTFEECRVDERKLLDEFRNYVLIGTIQSMGALYD